MKILIKKRTEDYSQLRDDSKSMEYQKKQSDSDSDIVAKHSSPDVKNVLSATIKELGKMFPDCRCLLYRLEAEKEVIVEHESSPGYMSSLLGQYWSISDNPFFSLARNRDSVLIVNNVTDSSHISKHPALRQKIVEAAVHSWLIFPIRDRDRLLGGIELHSQNKQHQWRSQDVGLIEALANSIGAALSQVDVCQNLVDLNTRLASVERVQSNLIAIVGHELRTPLSTIKICLESLATEPTMSAAAKTVMLDTALQDTGRLETLVQSFLTLSKLEIGKAYSNIESTDLIYAVNLALCRIQTTERIKDLPKIEVKFPTQLPLVLADIDGLIEVLIRLLDNACKFTPTDGKITISVLNREDDSRRQQLEVIVSDTGRGIESSQLTTIFDRFSQSEDYLRRTANGVGLGLVIARKVIEAMGGKMWAQSEGENRGSQFHFTLPIEI